MNEQQFWSNHVRPALHQPKAGRVAWKVQDAYNGGLPDVDFVTGVNEVAKIELKYIDSFPAKPETTCPRLMPTEGQFNHLEEWELGGGFSTMLIGVGDEWFLIHHTWLYPEAPTQQTVRDGALLTGLFRHSNGRKVEEPFYKVYKYIEAMSKVR